VQEEMADAEWVDADAMIDEWAAKHGLGTHVSAPVESRGF
jgi:hypothetical protein